MFLPFYNTLQYFLIKDIIEEIILFVIPAKAEI